VIFQNSPQMKMSRMNRTKNIVLHRMYKKLTPGSASLMGSFNIAVLTCNICMVFLLFFYGFTGSLLCLNISWNCTIFVRCYWLCSVLNHIKPLNKFQYSSGPGKTVQRMEFCCFLLYNVCFYIFQKLVL
jgi:hypothetical protein